jgi:uncharacterized protein YqeY
MYSEVVDHNIAKFLKGNDAVNLAVWRSIKAEFLNYKTAKAGNVLNDAVELNILGKMLAQRKDSASQFREGGRVDLAEKEEKEAEVLSALIPKEPTEDELEAAIKEAIATFPEGYAVSMRDMKTIQGAVKEKYPTANGGVVANIFRKFI